MVKAVKLTVVREGERRGGFSEKGDSFREARMTIGEESKSQ